MENVFDMKPEKAKITILDGPNKNQEINVMFNPSEYNVIYTAQIEEQKNKDPSFDKVKVEDFSVKLIFDTYEMPVKTDVRKITEKIIKLIMPFAEGKKKKRPPVCLFSWGKFSYKGIISKLDEKFILFLPDGTPVREELGVTFKAIMNQEEFNKLMGLEACRKVWTVKSGDRLDLIAEMELKDASLWRKIAQENNIDNPLKFPLDVDIGRRIVIPD